MKELIAGWFLIAAGGLSIIIVTIGRLVVLITLFVVFEIDLG